MAYPDTPQDNFRELVEKWQVFFGMMKAEPAVKDIKMSIREEPDGTQVCTITVYGHPKRGLKMVKEGEAAGRLLDGREHNEMPDLGAREGRGAPQ